MILADTSVVIDWLRSPSSRLLGIISTHATAIALDNNLELWTYDAHFALMQTALPALRLFVEPP